MGCEVNERAVGARDLVGGEEVGDAFENTGRGAVARMARWPSTAKLFLKRDGTLKRIPVIIVSSSDQPQDINRAYELGANAYMIKPMDFRSVEHLFQSITHYWGLECAKPEVEEEEEQHA